MEPGAAHDAQPGTRPVDGVALPLVQVHLVDAASDHDVEVAVVLPGGLLGAVVPLAQPAARPPRQAG